jgi:hypothetical protein
LAAGSSVKVKLVWSALPSHFEASSGISLLSLSSVSSDS